MAKPVQLDEKGYRKFSMRDSLAYAAGDFGCNMSFALKGTIIDADRRQYRRNKFLTYISFGSFGLLVARCALSPGSPRIRRSSRASCSSPAMCCGTRSTPSQTSPTVPCCP